MLAGLHGRAIPRFAAFDDADAGLVAIVALVELGGLRIGEGDPVTGGSAAWQRRGGDAGPPFSGEQRTASTAGCHDRRRAGTGCAGQHHAGEDRQARQRRVRSEFHGRSPWSKHRGWLRPPPG